MDLSAVNLVTPVIRNWMEVWMGNEEPDLASRDQMVYIIQGTHSMNRHGYRTEKERIKGESKK